MPYLAHYDHGSLRHVKRTREGCDLEWSTLAQEYQKDTHVPHHAIVLYMPHRIELECAAHAGRYQVHGYPCVALTIQQEPPSIPHGWPKK